VIRNTDLQQASRTVAKSFLATVWKYVRFDLNCTLEIYGTKDNAVMDFAYQHMALVFCLFRLVTGYRTIYLLSGSFFPVRSPGFGGVICVRWENSFGIIIFFCYKKIF